jgi:hypothetical protein
MENNMSYRDAIPAHHSSKPSSSSLPNYQDYDADDEQTLGPDAADFILPDGSGALDPAMLKRIEDAGKLLHKLEANRADQWVPKSGAGTNSSKEDQGSSSMPGDENSDYDRNIGKMLDEDLGDEQAEFDPMIAGDHVSDSPWELSESSCAGDSTSGKAVKETSATADMMDHGVKNPYGEDPEARIRFLKEIIKTKDEDLEMLRTMNRKHVETIRKLVLARESNNEKPEYEDHIIRKRQTIGAMLMNQGIKIDEDKIDRLSRRPEHKNPLSWKLIRDQGLTREQYFENKKRKAISKEDEDESMGDKKTPEHKRPKHKHRASLPSFPSSDRPSFAIAPDFFPNRVSPSDGPAASGTAPNFGSSGVYFSGHPIIKSTLVSRIRDSNLTAIYSSWTKILELERSGLPSSRRSIRILDLVRHSCSALVVSILVAIKI